MRHTVMPVAAMVVVTCASLSAGIPPPAAAAARGAVVAPGVAAAPAAAARPAAAAASQLNVNPPQQHPRKRLCGTPARGHYACLALIRTDVAAHKGEFSPDVAPGGYGPADLRSAYNLPSAAGAGETVAIVDAYDDPNAESDLGTYRAQFGLPACTTANGCFRKADQRGGASYPAPDPTWAGEISLDLDMVSAICPQCHILLVEADDASGSSLGGAVDEAVALGAKFVSNSYGSFTEDPSETASDPYYDHPGVAITASAGDNGYGVGYPAASKYVTAVGGTSLMRAAGTRGWAETAWSGTGSGCSRVEGKPSFQHDTACASRTVSDVSAVADPDTGVAGYDTYLQSGWLVFGGTSVSSPIIASVYALAGTPSAADYPNAYPYATPAALNDVTSGSNGYCGGLYLCTAGTGYDGPTGLGTPDGIMDFGAPGPHGDVTGTVTDAGTGGPVAGATVGTAAAGAVTDSAGHYDISVPAGDYDLTASAFGYGQGSAHGVQVSAGQRVTANFALTPQPEITVHGTVTDGSGQGWPLYAEIQVDGTPVTVFTSPYTGGYSIRLPAGQAYSLHVTARYPGYKAAVVKVGSGIADVSKDIAVPIDAVACAAPGYGWVVTGTATSFDDATAPPGWTVTDASGNGAWAFDDPGHEGNQTGGSGGFAIADAFHYAKPPIDTSLISPVTDLTGVPAPVLTFNDDYSGAYNSVADVDLSLDGGTTWTNVWEQTGGGDIGNPVHIDLPRAAGQPSVRVRFHYTASYAFWWAVDDVMLGVRNCDPSPGGLVAGRVTDGNTRQPLDAATVTSDDKPAEQAATAAVPADPAAGDGFYWMFSSLTGRRPFTAARPAYVPATTTLDVAPGGMTRADFVLGAGHLVVTPASVSATQAMGTVRTKEVTFTNDGASPVSVSLRQAGWSSTILTPNGMPVAGGIGGSSPQASAVAVAPAKGAPVSRIAGSYSPHRLRLAATRQAQARPGARVRPAVTPGARAWPAAAPWAGIANYPGPIMDNAVVTADDGKLYSVGGISVNAAVNSGYAYDPAARTWTPIATMSAARDVPDAAFISGKLYVTGGWLPSGLPEDTLEIYNPGSNSWSAGPSVPAAYAAAGTAVAGGKMYVVGGCGYSTCGSTDVFAYDPGTGKWSRAASYPQPVSYASCGGIDGRLYCAGGATDSGTTKNAYVYDPAHDAWTPIASLPIDLWGSGYTAANGQLLVSGGVTVGFSIITNQGFSYDPASNAWSPMANANLPLYRGGSACGFYRIGGSFGGNVGATAAAERLPGFTACGTSSNVPWLSESVLSGSGTAFTVAPGTSVRVRFVLDSRVAAVDQPGIYTARVDAQNDSPYPVALAAGMTVTAPRGWAKISGKVTGVYCDGSATALDGATIEINGRSGSFGLHTDSGGSYALWLDTENNPLTIIAARDGWWPRVRQVTIEPRDTTTASFALKTDAACG